MSSVSICNMKFCVCDQCSVYKFILRLGKRKKRRIHLVSLKKKKLIFSSNQCSDVNTNSVLTKFLNNPCLWERSLRAMLNTSTRDSFIICWASIAIATNIELRSAPLLKIAKTVEYFH